MKRLILPVLFAALPLTAHAEIRAGEAPPAVTLQGEDGARVDGTPWSSDELKGKVHVVFYVDPDERDLNEPAADALKAEAFDRARYGSVGIINMDASWLPNAILESSLEKKQKKFPDTVYVKDFKKVLVKQWGLADDNSDVLVFAPDGKLVFYKAGKLTDGEVRELVRVVRENLP